MFFLDLKLNICPVQQILVVGLILEPQQQVTRIDVVHHPHHRVILILVQAMVEQLVDKFY
jgi:hypothetical protein